LHIKYKSGTLECIIGRIVVIVLDPIPIIVRPVIVEIDGVGPPKAQADYEKMIDTAANILWWAGINLIRLGWRTKRVVSTAAQPYMQAGRISENAAGNFRPEYNSIMNATDITGAATEDDKINLLFVNSIQGAEGITFSALRFPWPNGTAIRESAAGDLMTGINIAHELGHFLGLANNLPVSMADKRSHSDDDPDNAHQKADIWAIRRLMYSNWPADTRTADPWARNVGYGADLSGCMISVRDHANDPTDDECRTARKWAKNAHFYRQ
jgi:hypothetical protein